MEGGMRVKIIVHYPKSEKGLSELSKKVSELHIEAIISYLNNQSCPKEQKIQIIEKIKEKNK